MGGGFISGTARIPMYPAIRRAIETGDGWTETKALWCIVCGELAHRENADPYRVACYKCSELTFNPDASFSPPRALEVRANKPLPKLEEIDWRQVSEVHVYGQLNYEGKAIVDAALTNKTHRVNIQSMDAEALHSVDHFVT